MNNDDLILPMTVMELRASMLLAVTSSAMFILSAKTGDDPVKLRQLMEIEIEKIIKIAIDRKRE